jgi:hypothetical protein
VTKTVPPAIVSRAAGSSSCSAAMASSAPRSLSAARRAALPAMNVVRLACAPTSHGFTIVSELTTSTRASGMPSVSATIIASTVSEPWPISVAPVMSDTVPKSSMRTMAPQPSER